MSNISDILTDALIYIGAVTTGQAANTDDLALALRVGNRLLDSMSAEKLSVVGLNLGTYALSGAASYTFGPGQTWAAPVRPVKIIAASTVAVNGVEKPINIANAERWVSIPDKTRTGIYVEDLMYDEGFPTGNISITPKPAAGSVNLWTYQVITALPNTSGTVTWAPGYELAFVNVLARELCPAFGRTLTEELNAAAERAKQVIVQLNAELFNAPAPSQPVEGPGPNPTSPPAQRVA